MNIPSILIPSTIFLFTLTGAWAQSDEEAVAQLAESAEAWEEAKAECGGNYHYKVTTSNMIGARTATTITVTNNEVSGRSYEEFAAAGLVPQLPGGAEAPAANSNNYTEEGDDVGRNDRGAPAKTLDELYAEAKAVLEAGVGEHEKLYLRFDDSGLLKSCFTVNTLIADDAPMNGVSISGLVLGAEEDE